MLVVKLRSIGDTVLATPSLAALRRFLPTAQIDILLENWVAPLLDGLELVDNVLSVGSGTIERLAMMRRLYRAGYDAAFNLHGGTTSTFLTAASRARHRVGWAEYQYSFLYDHLYTSASDFWGREKTHSAEQQLALLGFAGVPVRDRPRSILAVTASAAAALDNKFRSATGAALSEFGRFALVHPAAAFATKQWPAANFAEIASFLAGSELKTVAVAARTESAVLRELTASASVPVVAFDDLSLPVITALASRAELFVGNDSGIAHIAGAVNTPCVVIFGSSNRDHWRPWTDAPSEIVYEAFECQPCAGYECRRFGEPKCIMSVTPAAVKAAIERVLAAKIKSGIPTRTAALSDV